MRPAQWEIFKRAVRREKIDKIPMALIIDSPWIPGYLGIKHLDYFLDPELWFQSNLKIMREFPDIIFIPSWWMEYGMAAEPSVLGAKIKFWQDNTPANTTRFTALRISTASPSTKSRPTDLRALPCTASGWRASEFWMRDTFCPW